MTTPSDRAPDLTPFGFTPTESAAYFTLLRRGPSSGYALATDMSLAKANAYQALHGLVAKNAAEVVGEAPLRYRAIRPENLYAQIVGQQTAQLDRLEEALNRAPASGSDTVVRITGRRAVSEWMSRTTARQNGPVTLVAAHPLLATLSPALRKRLADHATTIVWLIGTPGELPVPVAGTLPEARLREFFATEVALLLTDGGAMMCRVADADTEAFWTTDSTLVGTTRAAIAALTQGSRQ